MRRAEGRSGRLNLAWWTFLGSIALVGILTLILSLSDPSWERSKTSQGPPLMVFCAAGLKGPVEAVAKEYQNQTGREIQLQYGGSNTLLASLQVGGRGDLFIPADESYIATAREKGVIAEVLPIARMKLALVVPMGNPKKIRSLQDLLTRKLRVAQANPESAAVGKVAREVLTKRGLWKALEERTFVTKPTVTEVASDVQIGAVDAAIVWDAIPRQIDGLEIVPSPELETGTAKIASCVTTGCNQPQAALHFARYLGSRDRGQSIFRRFGLEADEGDLWEDIPEVKLLAGAMLRPAIEKTVVAFEDREGVRISRVFNGCGILVSQMLGGNMVPDAFFACDREFMKQVDDFFTLPTAVSGNQLVILVAKGNPHQIRKLRDLGRPGLRVGIGHEKQCAMGVITQKTLREDRTSEIVMKNVRVQSPTGDMLVNQMLTGSLDAVIAYISNAAGHADRLEAVALDLPCALAEQPFAVSKSSRHPHLMGRLLAALQTSQSRETFEALGFTWKGTP